MTPDDVSRVLAAAAARDSRTVGVTDVLAWHQDIGDLDLDDALEAVSRHYRQTTDRLMPAHVHTLVEQIRRERRRELALEERQRHELETGPEPARGPLRDRSAGVQAIVLQVAEKLSTTDAIHERAKLRSCREHGRPDLSRKPGKTRPPGKAKDWPPPADDAIAALATRYLIDDHTPDQVADKLYISRRWCRHTITHLRNGRPSTQEPTDAPA